MARVLICEPHDDVRALLELVVRRLGHEPAAYLGRAVEQIGVDVAVIEPGESEGLSLALKLLAQNVPFIFTSIYPPTDDLLELAPSAYLVKPFPVSTLECALVQAIALVSAPAAAAG